MGENMDQNNSEYGHFSRSDSLVDASRNLYLSVKANLTKIEIKTSKYEPSIRLCKVLDPSLIVQYLKQNDISLSLSLEPIFYQKNPIETSAAIWLRLTPFSHDLN